MGSSERIAIPADAQPSSVGSNRGPRRDSLLGAAFVALAAGALLGASAKLIGFIDSLDDRIAGALAHTVDLLSGITWVVAFSWLAVTFLVSREGRANRIFTGLLLAAGALALFAIASALEVYEAATGDFTFGTLTASSSVTLVSGLIGACGAWVAAIAFLRSRASGFAIREERLGWAASFFAFALVLQGVSTILLSIFFSDLGATSRLSGAIVVTAVSSFVVCGAAIVAAVAFFLSSTNEKGHLPQGALSKRDTLLAVAAGIFAGGFLLASIGALLAATALSENGFPGSSIASAWLNAGEAFVWVAAGVSTLIGFLLTRNSSPVASPQPPPE